MSDIWIDAYERVSDDYMHNANKYGEEFALEIARRELRGLGLDPHEIRNELEGLQL